MNNKISSTDSLVLFKNIQGIEVRGTMIHLTRGSIIFEIYNPYSIVQVSEVLQDLSIFRGERIIYKGRAVVRNLVQTGLMVICSASLDDSWSELSHLTPGHGLREEIEKFVGEWERSNVLRPSYQLAVDNLKMFLSEISQLLLQIDLVLEKNGPAQSPKLVNSFFREIEEPILPKIEELFSAFEYEASIVPEEEVDSHKSFVRRTLHPLILCSPFVHRIYTKPLGYAGDYIMVNMMNDDPLKGPTTYAKLINHMCLRQDAAEAHRNRINMIENILSTEALRASEKKRKLDIMTVGCGPAIEIQNFIRQNKITIPCTFHLLDFNNETIEYAREKISAEVCAGNKNYRFNYIHKSINDLLREMIRSDKKVPGQSFDLLYCAGLFDYFSDRICKRLIQAFHQWLNPGGLLIVTNVHPKNPFRYFMEHIVEWHLVYRSETEFKKLAPEYVPSSMYSDPTGVNIFMEIRKES